MKYKQSLSVVIPAYNEELNIERAMNRALQTLDRLFEKFEIIIVNDNSSDRTAEIADSLAAGDKRIRVLHNQVNLRQGASLLKGFAEARYELVIHDAMDYPFDLEDLVKLMPYIEGNDIVVACREQRAGYSLYRHFLSHANILLLHLFFELKLPDYNFVQLYKKQVLERVQVRARSTGFVTPELVIRAHRMGFKVASVPIQYLPREAGVAHSGAIKVIAATLRDLLSFWWDSLRGK